MKPTTPRKGRGKDDKKDIVNQPKITNFFVKADPNAPNPTTSAGVRQTKLLDFATMGSSASKAKGKTPKIGKGRGKQPQRERKKLVSTKVIPDSQVITLSSSDDSSDETATRSTSKRNASTNGVAEQVAGPSGTSHKQTNGNPNIHTAVTQKMEIAYDEETEDDTDEETITQLSKSQAAKLSEFPITRDPDPASKTEVPLPALAVPAPASISEVETQAMMGLDKEKQNKMNYENMETQLDEGQDEIHVDAETADGGDGDGRESPSLLNNCNSQILRIVSNYEFNGNLDEPAKNADIAGINDQETCRVSDKEDDDDDPELMAMIDEEVERQYGSGGGDKNSTTGTDNDKNSSPGEPSTATASKAEAPAVQMIALSSVRDRESSPPPEARGKIFVTPIKNLLEPSTPTKKSPYNLINGHTTPTKPVKSKKLKFSPVMHMNKSPSRNRTKSGQFQNSPQKNGIPGYFTPVKTTPSNNNSPSTSTATTASAGTGSPTKPKISGLPYYLENFLEILNAVASDDHHSHLFNENDLILIEAFNNVNVSAQSLYVRLHTRQWKWRPVNTIKYKEMKGEMEEHFKALHEKKLLVKLNHEDKEKIDLEELLRLSNADQINDLAKKMGLKNASKTKNSCIEALVKSTKSQRTLSGSGADILYKAACETLGPTYKVTPDSKRLFDRIFILHSPPQYWEEEADQGTNQLLTALLTKQGKMQHPSYKISKSIKMYKEREDVLRFQEAWTLHSEIQSYLDAKTKDWDSAQAVCEQALEQFQTILSDNHIQQHDRSLPTFLRAYTAGSLLSRTLFLGIDAYQKTKNYDKANEVISILMGQDLYSLQYRGRCVARLIVNAKHLKKTADEMKQIILDGLTDQKIHDANKFNLRERLEKLLASESITKAKAKKRMAAAKVKKRRSKRSRSAVVESSDGEEEDDEMETEEDLPLSFDLSSSLYKLQHELPTREFTGEKMEREDNRGGKSAFIGSSSTSSPSGNSVSGVESFAKEQYKKIGYTNGLHGEGAVPVALFGLLFWDITFYDEIPDVFHSPYQSYPLDMNFDEFYQHRKDLIDKRLDNIRNSWSLEDAFDVIDSKWHQYQETISIFPRDVFDSVGLVKSLVKSMGLKLVAALCERLAKNYRYSRSGFPDLTLWNSSECIFVEVKGPGDSLAPKQSLWLDYLIKVGAKAEVCFVKSVSNKRIRTS